MIDGTRAIALPAPPRPRTRALVAAAAVAIALAGSVRASEVDLRALFGAEGRRAIGAFLEGFLHPALSGAFLEALLRPLLETLAIGVAGITLGFLVGFPLSILATDFAALGGDERATSSGAARTGMHLARWTARLTLNLMRSIPDL